MPTLISNLPGSGEKLNLAVTDTLVCASAYTPQNMTAYTPTDKCLNSTAASPLQYGNLRLKTNMASAYQIITVKDSYWFYPDFVFKNVYLNPQLIVTGASSSGNYLRVSGTINDWYWFSTSDITGVIPVRINMQFYSVPVSASTWYFARNYTTAQCGGLAATAYIYPMVSSPGSSVNSSSYAAQNVINGNDENGHGLHLDFDTIKSIVSCPGEVTGFGRMTNSNLLSSVTSTTNVSSYGRGTSKAKIGYYSDYYSDCYSTSGWRLYYSMDGNSVTAPSSSMVWNRNMWSKNLHTTCSNYNVATDMSFEDAYRIVANTGATSTYNYVLATTITRGSYTQEVQIRVETFVSSTYSTLFYGTNQQTNEIITLDQYADSKTQPVTIYSSTVNTSYIGIRVTPLTINTAGNVGLHNSSYLLFTPVHAEWNTSSVQNPMQFYTNCSNATSESVLMTIEVNG